MDERRSVLIRGILVLSLLVLGACHKRATSPKPEPGTIIGDWDSSCYRVGQHYHQVILSIDPLGKLLLTENLSSKVDCSDADSSAVIAGTYLTGEAHAQIQGAYMFQAEIPSGIAMAIHNEAMVESANQNSFLGFSDWKLNNYKDVTEAVASESLILPGFIGAMKRSYFKVDGDYVFFGNNVQTKRDYFIRQP